ncbi:diguanylate cyclase domain-containing protein [Metabacillus dongyingensis]|uniref:sensor domain-containing diguanylate cyclase n=1 Tax=Metabacillus dongyingensis TaxID=2874282 RepID=UPI001CC19381|nr:diguanylate cyclase [Metabacillus dongyingensis]UAL51332.1 diguanylate cyclase [Metabacillus dongyingensis]
MTHLTEYTLMSIKSLFFDYISSESLQNSKTHEEYFVSTLQNAMNSKDAALFKYENHKFVLLAATAGFYQFNRIVKQQNRVEMHNHEVELLIPGEFLIVVKEEKNAFSKEFYEKLQRECDQFLSYFIRLFNKKESDAKHKSLYQLTEKLHSTMSKDEVLNQLIFSLQTMFPAYLFYLFLSQDNENKQNLLIKSLDYEGNYGNEKAMEAYLTGDVQWELSKHSNQLVVYAPLKGNQGVYGVLEVTQQNQSDLNSDVMLIITSLAKAAGNALENAKLYEQSKKLVSDLQLINETSQRLNKNLRLIETMTFMSERIMRSFSAEEVGFYYMNEERQPRILPGSTPFFHKRESEPYINLVHSKVSQQLEGMFMGEVRVNESSEFSSLIAIPMIQSEQLKGFAIVLHSDSYFFTFEMFKLLQSLIHHSTLALMNSMLREELEQLVKTDHLTKLHSRNFLDESVQSSLEKDRQGTFILMDIDNFKQINDTYGHQVGDEVLIQVAKIMKNSIGEYDIGARWGGEELAVYLPQGDLAAGITFANSLAASVRKETVPTVTVSCGVAHWREGRHDTLKRIIMRADKGLYNAKESGKNCVIFQEDIEVE